MYEFEEKIEELALSVGDDKYYLDDIEYPAYNNDVFSELNMKEDRVVFEFIDTETKKPFSVGITLQELVDKHKFRRNEIIDGLIEMWEREHAPSMEANEDVFKCEVRKWLTNPANKEEIINNIQDYVNKHWDEIKKQGPYGTAVFGFDALVVTLNKVVDPREYVPENKFQIYFEFCEGKQTEGIRKYTGQKMSISEFNQLFFEEVANTLIFQDNLLENIQKYKLGKILTGLSENFDNPEKILIDKGMENILEDWHNVEITPYERSEYYEQIWNVAKELECPVFMRYDKAYFELQLNGETIDGGRMRFDIGDDYEDVKLREKSIFDRSVWDYPDATTVEMLSDFPTLSENQKIQLSYDIQNARDTYHAPDPRKIQELAAYIFKQAFPDAEDRFKYANEVVQEHNKKLNSDPVGRNAQVADKVAGPEINKKK